jgi:DTW domain-containing protein YfiP
MHPPRVLVLQHPAERNEPLATVPVLCAQLPEARVRVGFVWRSLAAAWGADAGEPSTWGVLYPASAPPGVDGRGPARVVDRAGAPIDGRVTGIVALDGTWSEVKTLWWRNPWLVRLPRVILRPRDPPLYGSLRREPKRGYVSTLEAVADALVVVDPRHEAARAALRAALAGHLEAIRTRALPGAR